jgi:hypothetical protein
MDYRPGHLARGKGDTDWLQAFSPFGIVRGIATDSISFHYLTVDLLGLIERQLYTCRKGGTAR